MKKVNEILSKKEFVITLDDAHEMLSELWVDIYLSNDEKNVIVNRIKSAIGVSNMTTLVDQIIANNK